jgi:hypothetical protein
VITDSNGRLWLQLRAKTQRLGKENAGLKQELAATTRTQLSPARTHAHFSKTQGKEDHDTQSPTQLGRASAGYGR